MKEIEIRRRHRRHQVSPSQQRVPVRAPMGGNTEQFFGAATAAEKFLVVVRKGGREGGGRKQQNRSRMRIVDFATRLQKLQMGHCPQTNLLRREKKSQDLDRDCAYVFG